MEILTNPEAWLAFATLTALEIVLGIDNIIFISILVARLPQADQARGRTIGLSLAMLTRIVLLLSITWVMGLSADLFTIGKLGISGRDLILIGGGLFLLAKSTLEIHNGLEGEEEHAENAVRATFTAVMMFLAGPIGHFVDRHPTIKMLALSFLILIGMALVGEGLGFHIPKGYIYFAMAFSVAVEMLNIQMRKRMGTPVKLRKKMEEE
jgi:predicted tellurium resistance membrane protein TerC